jgi:hypothetical protein
MHSKIKKSCNRFKIDLVTLQLCKNQLQISKDKWNLALYKLKIFE